MRKIVTRYSRHFCTIYYILTYSYFFVSFRPAFYLYATLKIFSGVLMLLINLEFKAPASNVVSDVLSVLKNIEVVALLLACFTLGT